MEIDPAALARSLYEEPAMEQASPEISPYLPEHVLAPYLRGEEIEIKGIDYGAFTPQEMSAFLQYVNELARENEMVHGLWKFFRTLKPLALRKPAFC